MKSILVVDDDYKLRQIYNRCLTSEGYKVMEAESAADANEILKKKKIDLMLLDIKMPEINGDVLYNIARMFHGEVKVIVTSVYPVEEQKRFIEGANGYYDKARGIDSLLTEIREVICDEPSKDYTHN